jgi:hypothetical protein
VDDEKEAENPPGRSQLEPLELKEDEPEKQTEYERDEESERHKAE